VVRINVSDYELPRFFWDDNQKQGGARDINADIRSNLAKDFFLSARVLKTKNAKIKGIKTASGKVKFFANLHM